VARIKGTNVVNAVKMLRTQRERALAGLPAHLHSYLDERILVSSWYPEEDQLGLLRALASFMPRAPDPYVTMGRGTARSDLTGIYKNQFRAGDVARTLSFAGALWRNAHDSGEMTTEVEGASAVAVRLRNYGAVSREMCRVCTGYFVEVVWLAAGKSGDVQHTECRVDGAPVCVWRVRW
jgi:hypothetical protein